MSDIFGDPPLRVYLVLAVVVAAAGFVAFRKQTLKGTVPLSVALLLVLSVFLIDLFVETAREEATRKIQSMADASRAGALDEMFGHVSEDFDYRGVSRDGLRVVANRVSGQWQGAKVWDFEKSASEELPNGDVKIGFLVQGIGFGAIFYCEATFTTDPDGERRLKTFEFYNSLQRTNGPPESIPGLG